MRKGVLSQRLFLVHPGCMVGVTPPGGPTTYVASDRQIVKFMLPYLSKSTLCTFQCMDSGVVTVRTTFMPPTRANRAL